ncbi:MAG: hypothetical protein ABIQ70_11575 [Dokdonella sp.]
MLKELNSIANGLLGLHGYPAGPTVAAETPPKRAPVASVKSAATVRVSGKSATSCVPVVPVRARSYFAW